MAECASLQATHCVARSAFEANLQWAPLGSMTLSEARQPPGLACGQCLINDPPVGASEPFPARGGVLPGKWMMEAGVLVFRGCWKCRNLMQTRVWFKAAMRDGIVSLRVTVCPHPSRIPG